MEFDNIVIVDIFASIVDSMRETSDITSFTEVNGRYTIASSNELNEDDAITIDGVDYLVISPTVNQFEIDADTGLDFTGKSWKAKAPYYMHGHPLEIVNRLNKKNKGIYGYQKYPLIALFQDFEENVNDDLAIYANTNLTLIIANLTRPEIKADDRYDRNFREILYPLYYELLNKIHYSRLFNTNSPRTINHTKIDRLYWGSQEGNANIHDDYIDAIEINSLNLQVIDNRCKV